MPLYDYECRKCEHSWEESNKMAERDKPLSEPCPKCGEEGAVIKKVGCAAVVDPFLLGLQKPSQSFREIMKNVVDTSSPRVKRNLGGKF